MVRAGDQHVISRTLVVVVRIGWMTWYRGVASGEAGPVGGGSFNDSDIGSEVENFAPIDGWCHGYAQVSRRSGGFNLRRIDHGALDGHAGGVLVIMVARSPALGSQVVVGWYSRATVFAQAMDRPSGYGLYNFEAPRDGCVLLPIETRLWRVPKGAGGMGQANVLYVLDDDGIHREYEWLSGIVDRIVDYDGDNLLDHEVYPLNGSAAVQPFPEDPRLEPEPAVRRAIESYAMSVASEYFVNHGFIVEDVSSREPYDLLCTRNGAKLRVEVKGTRSSGAHVHVTANEVANAKEAETALFILCNIHVEFREDDAFPSGGEWRCLWPWKPMPSELEATAYRYRVPPRDTSEDAGQ